jgi:hypothetical protein
MSDIRIYYTGTLITPDGSDTGVYGDACEPGAGATMATGWVDPNWSRYEVREDRDDVRPDVFTADDGPLIDWIVRRLVDRLSWIESPADSDGRTYYAAESDSDPYTGESMMLAAHIDAPPAILAAVQYALAHERTAHYEYVWHC